MTDLTIKRLTAKAGVVKKPVTVKTVGSKDITVKLEGNPRNKVFTPVFRLYDAVAVIEVFGTTSLLPLSLNLSDGATISEQRGMAVNKVVSDTLSITDVFGTGLLFSFDDALSVAETTTKLVNKNNTETLNVTEMFQLQVNKSLTDTITATELFAPNSGNIVIFTDTITVLEQNNKTLAKTLLSSLVVTEIVPKSAAKQVNDSAVLNETGDVFVSSYFDADYIVPAERYVGTSATFT